MVFLALSFLAGVLSVLAACVLPLLPVIVGGSLAAGGSRRRVYTIIAALAVSVVVFTLLLKASTVLIGVPEELWRYLSGGIVAGIGLFMLFPKLWTKLPGVNALNRGSNQLLGSGYRHGGFWGDVTMGAALGPVFASCSPTYFIILATVLPADLALGFVYLGAYAAGLSLALLVIALTGEKVVAWLGVSLDPEGKFFRGLGVLLIVVGILVFTGAMRTVETWLVERGFNTTFIELKLLGSEEKAALVQSADDAPFLSIAMKQGLYPKAPEIVAPDGYINTPRLRSGQAGPITIGEFKGKKVVLVDIWTYSCINCQRTFPYLKDWYAKYKDAGLEIIGVHTPEFAFEQVFGNVERAARQFGLTYPIILDNEYRTWNAFGNQFWPRKYLIDIDGFIVYDHAGEGNYAEAERAIQRALAERAARLGVATTATSTPMANPTDIEVVDATKLGSPETYFGAARNEYLGAGVQGKTGEQYFEEPQAVLPNRLYLIGLWNITGEYAETPSSVGSGSTGSDRINYLYRAKHVYLVAGSVSGSPIEVEVLRDSKPLDASFAGTDVHFKQGRSYISIDKNRLYDVIRDSAYGAHLLEFIILSPGFQAYTFTFG